MATITPVKTAAVDVLTHQAATHPITIVGSTQNVATKMKVSIFLFHGYVEATADTNPGKFLIQVRPDAGGGSVNEHWVTIAEITARGTTPDTEAMTATEPAGETVMAVAATAGFVAEDELYIQDTTTLADSEWAKCQEIVTNTSIDLMDGLTTQKDNADVIWNDSTKAVVTLDLEAGESYRVVWMHEGAVGANGHVKAMAITHDSYNAA